MTDHNPIDHDKLVAHATRLNKEAEAWTARQLRSTYNADALCHQHNHDRPLTSCPRSWWFNRAPKGVPDQIEYDTKPIDWYEAPMPLPSSLNPPTKRPTMLEPTPTVRRLSAALCLCTYTLLAIKVFGGVDMSWWTVFSPLWGTLALALVVGSATTLVRGR